MTALVRNLNSKLRYLRNGTRGCQLLLITNRKSHTGFRLVPTSMTLNDLERRNSFYFAFLRNSTDFQADYITVVEDRPRPIMSVNHFLPVPVFYFWRKL